MKLILGSGKSSAAAVDHLKQKGETYRHVEQVDDPVDLKGITCVVKSPGIPMRNPWIVDAQNKSLKVITEIDLALAQMEHRTLIGITGSNGKSTTAMAVAHVLGERATLGGNIGIPLLNLINHPAEIIVIELSSFQLEVLDVKPVFHAGVILNITPNHLDHHTNFDEYCAAKKRLKACMKPGALFFSEKDVEEFFKTEYRDGAASHDVQNFAVACALCESVGVEKSIFEQKMRSFKKPPHRIESIGVVHGVEYINDSKATSVDAVKKAVAAMTKPVILIAGGVDKGGAFSEWAPLFCGKVKKIFAIGPAAHRIENELGREFQVEKEQTLECALEKASVEAQVGECILLSPGCSSFDAFESFEHRGDAFREHVKRRKL